MNANVKFQLLKTPGIAQPKLQPGQNSTDSAVYLADFDGTRCAGESGQASLKRGYLREGAAATSVDASDTELVRRPGLKLHFLHLAVVRNDSRIVLMGRRRGKKYEKCIRRHRSIKKKKKRHLHPRENHLLACRSE